ncbi:MAG: hypothetical protein DWQ44_06570 [Bacteroidetes bacterium]|nr:MAG: hypothetical protein DWQ33_03040 [Bacteroidota bacterium]REK00961.1 MAG: hypothetical protein DWQ39_10335 [Bacteroidota bacterium]REK34564.1 MAG: hypothetical protein DWQ44_06570 [Bacteroidota bacterium]REK51823.1 MAG: hypothetical protein DWQ48_00170 [Bacteroidota bacterium]
MRSNLKFRNSRKLKLKFTPAFRVVTGAFILGVLTFSASWFASMITPEEAMSASNYIYRTKESGSFDNPAIWESSNGAAWIASSNVPSASNSTIIISSGHTVTINSNITLDEVIVDTDATLNVQAGTLTIVDNPSGSDLIVKGTLNIFSTLDLRSLSRLEVFGVTNLKNTGAVVNNSASIWVWGRFKREGGSMPVTSGLFNVRTGGVFEHAMDGSSLPQAAWQNGAICEITGVVSSIPGNISQQFKSLVWNSPGMTGDINLGNSMGTVQGDLIIRNLGNASLFFDQQGNNTTQQINGNLNVEGGNLFICVNGSATVNVQGDVNVTGGSLNFNKTGGTAYGNQSGTMNVDGNVNISGGSMVLSNYNSSQSNKGIGILNIKGNLVISGSGLLTEASSVSRGQVFFNKPAGTSLFISNGNITNRVDVTVNPNVTLDMADNVFTGNGDFTLSSTAGLIIGSSDGITLNQPKGNVQNTGGRNFNSNADYTYRGTVAQVSGDGLPSQVRNLTIQNPSHVTLEYSTSVNSTLNFISGNFITNSNVLTVGINTSTVGSISRTSGHVVGNLRRWVSSAISSTNMNFPVGTMAFYNAAIIRYTTNPSTYGTITASFIPTNPGSLGLPLMDDGDNCVNVGYGYWSLTSGNGLNNGVYSLNLLANGFPMVSDFTALHILRRTGADAAWTNPGTHLAGSGSNVAPVANRTGLGPNVFGHFGITSGIVNVLPITLSEFRVKSHQGKVQATWVTATEVNNEYFSLERSEDNQNYIEIARVQGAGNSTVKRNYAAEDAYPPQGLIYYRLRQTDYDGTSTVSEPQTVRNNSKPAEPVVLHSVSPSPFSSELTLRYTLDQDCAVSVRIISHTGNIVKSVTVRAFEGINEANITDLSFIPPGPYFIRITSPNGSDFKKAMKR